MKRFRHLAAVSALAIAVVAAFATPAVAHESEHSQQAHGRDEGVGRSAGRSARGADHVVFVQTDDPAGNAVVVYDRADDGTLTPAGSYATGGNGGVLNGSVVDHLASQGSLVYDPGHALLFAVNAGSNTVSVFSAHRDRLELRQVLSSFGQFPVSLAVHGDLLYVLNARDGGSVQGYAIVGEHVFPLAGANRSLGLDPNATPEFVNTPGQVVFTPDGSQLIVTTKANGNSIDVFGVEPFGALSAPAVNAEPGTVPFAVAFDAEGNLAVTEAGPNTVATFSLAGDGTLTPLHSAATGQAATCWIVGTNSQFYAANAGSASLSRVQSGPGGAVTLLDNTGTDAGTVDASISAGGHFLYVQTGANGIVDEFRINDDGSLSSIGSVTVAGSIGGEGIVAI